VLGQLLKKYPNQVNLVIKHFPLRMHKFAEKASLAALAAAKQGKYEQLTTVLLKNFKSLNDETIKKHAEEVGLNMEQFTKDLNDPALKKQIQDDMRLGNSAKVRGVPAIFINGRTAKQRSLQGFSQMVEQELKKE
jgi:protein-disulfide isomerase